MHTGQFNQPVTSNSRPMLMVNSACCMTAHCVK